MNNIISGGCHCGKIRYQLKTEFKLSELAVRICSCDFCTKSGNQYISDPKAKLTIFWDASQINRYQFGTKTADFVSCKKCGVTPFVLSEIDNEIRAVINTNSIDDQDQLQLKEIPKLDYDGEIVADRLARRKNNWIGTVAIGNQ